MAIMELNDFFLALIIIIVVVLLLSAIYKFGMSRKSFEEILEEQKQNQFSLLVKPKVEKKKEKKKQSNNKKKTSEKDSLTGDETNQEEEDLIFVEKSKEVRGTVGVVTTKSSGPAKKKVSKEHQVDKLIEELASNDKTSKTKLDKASSNDNKGGKIDASVENKSGKVDAPSKKQPASVAKEPIIVKSVAPAATEKLPSAPRQNSKSPVTQTSSRSTDAGPVNVDAKKKKNKDAEVNVTECEKIVAAAAPITKAAPSVGIYEKDNVAVHQQSNEAKKNKGVDLKQDKEAQHKDTHVAHETISVAKLTSSTGSTFTGTEWTTKNQKGDPNVTLKKQLDDKDGELRMLQAQLQAVNARYNDSRQELADNVQKLSTLDKTLKQQLSAKEQECAELRKRVTSGPGASVKGPSNDGQVQVIMHLTEENRQLKETIAKLQQQTGQVAAQQQQQAGGADLKQQVKFMDDALKQNSKLLNTSENNRKTLEVKLKQIEEELKKSNQKASDNEKKYREAVDRLTKVENSNKTSVNDGELKAYQAKLKEKEQQTVEVEAQLKVLETKFGQLQQRLQDQDAEILSLRSKNGPNISLNGQGNGFLESNGNNDITQQYTELVREFEASNKTIQELEVSNKEKSDELRKSLDELNMLRMSHDKEIQSNNDKISDLTSKLEEQKVVVSRLESVEKEKTIELETAKQEMQKIAKAKDDHELQLERFSDVSNELDRTKEDILRLQSANEEKSKELRQLSEELSFYRSSHNDIEVKDRQLNENLEELNKYKEKINQLQTELVDKTRELEILQQSNDNTQRIQIAQKEEYEHSLNSLEQQKEAILRLQNEKPCEKCALNQQTSSNNAEELQQNIIPNGSSHTDNSEELEGYKSAINKLEEESSRKSQELQRVQEELELLRISHNDLMNQGQRFLEASNILEQSKVNLDQLDQLNKVDSLSSSPTIPQDVQKLANLSNEVVRYQEDVQKLKKSSEQKVLELETVRNELNDVKRANKELSQRLADLSNSSKDAQNLNDENEGLEVELTEAKESESKLQTEVRHYQTVLHETERILRQLQENVEMEEQNWQQKLQTTQNQVQEYVTKIGQLEQRLQESQNEKQRLLNQLNQELVNGTSPSIDHKEERIRKSDRAVVYPAAEVTPEMS